MNEQLYKSIGDYIAKNNLYDRSLEELTSELKQYFDVKNQTDEFYLKLNIYLYYEKNRELFMILGNNEIEI